MIDEDPLKGDLRKANDGPGRSAGGVWKIKTEDAICLSLGARWVEMGSQGRRPEAGVK